MSVHQRPLAVRFFAPLMSLYQRSGFKPLSNLFGRSGLFAVAALFSKSPVVGADRITEFWIEKFSFALDDLFGPLFPKFPPLGSFIHHHVRNGRISRRLILGPARIVGLRGVLTRLLLGILTSLLGRIAIGKPLAL